MIPIAFAGTANETLPFWSTVPSTVVTAPLLRAKVAVTLSPPVSPEKVTVEESAETTGGAEGT